MDHFEKYANEKGETLNSMLVKIMKQRSKFKDN